jgi:ribosome-binding factor A
MTPDLKLAYVYFTTFEGKNHKLEILEGFESSLGFLKRNLAQKLGLRYMPKLKFFYDESFDYGTHIDSILKSIESDRSS